ncbi:TPA: hypothetical protein ACIADH_000807 [Escherichia coli]
MKTSLALLLITCFFSQFTLAENCKVTANQQDIAWGKVDRSSRTLHTINTTVVDGIALPERYITLNIQCDSPHYVHVMIDGNKLTYKGKSLFKFGEQSVIRVKASNPTIGGQSASVSRVSVSNQLQDGGTSNIVLLPSEGISFMQHDREQALTQAGVQLAILPLITGKDINPQDLLTLTNDLNISLNSRPE